MPMRDGVDTDLKINRQDILKSFLKMFLPAALMIGAILALVYHVNARAEKKVIKAKEIALVDLEKKSTRNTLNSVISDLLVQAGHHDLIAFSETGDKRDLKAVEQGLIMFVKIKKSYDQLRFLDLGGKEVIRINNNEGSPFAVPEDRLQNKTNRYYFKDSVNLDKGEVYISPFDLNIEGGVIENPLKPMIRFITPVFDSEGRRTGLLVFNYLGKEIIDRIKMASAGALDQLMLLNSEGYWLKGRDPKDEWGFMYEEGQGRKFAKLFPDGWKRISTADSGQFQNEDGLFTFTTINPIAGALTTSTGVEGYKWIFVSHIPPKLFNAIPHRLLRGLLSLYASLVFLVGGSSWFIASASMRRKLAEEKLRKYRNSLEEQVEKQTAELTGANKELQREISERKRTEEALKENEAKYRLVHATAFDGIIIANTDNRVIECNRSAENIFGYESGGLVGRKLIELMPVEFRERHFAGFQRFLETGKSKIQGKMVELQGLRKDGEVFPIEFIINSFELNGETFFTGTVRDITERKKAEEQLRQLNEALEERVEERTRDLQKTQKKLLSKERLAAIGQLSSNIAHELRNPLGVIGNTAYYLNMKLKDGDEKVLKHLEILDREVRRSNKIISCLLDFSRTKKPSIVACDINRIIKESLTDIEKDEKVSIDTRLNGNLPEILIDPDQINQVIMNLLTNAVHAMPEGGRIEIATGVKKDFLEVVLKDTGAGIPKKDLRKIFEPLYTSKAKGTGLGLSIARGIIDRHKGRIGVESKVGEGSTFTVSLPLDRKEA